MNRINEDNSDFENETGTYMIDVLEDDEIVIDDDKFNSCTLFFHQNKLYPENKPPPKISHTQK